MTIVSSCSEEKGDNKIKGSLKLAMAQMLVDGGNINANLERAVQRINTAAENRTDTIVYQDVVLLERPARGTSWSGYRNSLKK